MIVFTLTQVKQTFPPIQENAFTEACSTSVIDAEKNNNTIATNNAEYFNIKVFINDILQDSSSLSFSENSHLNTSFTNGQIAFMTLGAFLAINVFAWYCKKYNIGQETSENQEAENVLNSVYENIVINDFMYKLFISMIPLSILIIYKLRYYYYNLIRLKIMNRI
jgi:hypothetical protein